VARGVLTGGGGVGYEDRLEAQIVRGAVAAAGVGP